jgi:hypothetical protein
MTVLDISMDIIVGRPTVREERLVRVLPLYFCAPITVSAPLQLLDATPVVPQTRDAEGQLLDESQQPSHPAGQQGSKTGKELSAPRGRRHSHV